MTLQLIMSRESITVEGCNMIASGSYGPHRSSCASCSNGAALRGMKSTNQLEMGCCKRSKTPALPWGWTEAIERSKSKTALKTRS